MYNSKGPMAKKSTTKGKKTSFKKDTAPFTKNDSFDKLKTKKKAK